MNKKFKIASIILIIILIVIIVSKFFRSNDTYYRFVADTLVNFYHSDKYDDKKIRKDDREKVKEYLSHLTHNDEVILLDDFIIKSSDYYISKSNSQGVYKENGKCYIKYNDIGFDKYHSSDYEYEPHREVICDNYRIILYESYFYPKYSETKNNPKYDYYFEKMEKKLNTYTYYYQSSYDGTYFKISITIDNNKIFKITTGEEVKWNMM